MAVNKQQEKINQLTADIINADNEGNHSKVLSCYTSDIVWFPPDGKVINGKNEISKRYMALYDNYDLDIYIEPGTTKIDGDLAVQYGITRGKMVSKKDKKQMKVYDRYMMVFERKNNTKWKVSILMWNNLTS